MFTAASSRYCQSRRHLEVSPAKSNRARMETRKSRRDGPFRGSSLFDELIRSGSRAVFASTIVENSRFLPASAHKFPRLRPRSAGKNRGGSVGRSRARYLAASRTQTFSFNANAKRADIMNIMKKITWHAVSIDNEGTGERVYANGT
jgi:hypothetical protein